MHSIGRSQCQSEPVKEFFRISNLPKRSQIAKLILQTTTTVHQTSLSDKYMYALYILTIIHIKSNFWSIRGKV
jgi:hypothetical protein